MILIFQVETFKDRLKESESLHRQEVESAQTHSDQNMLELRRKFDKLDMGYQEQIEKAQEKHEQEIGKRELILTHSDLEKSPNSTIIFTERTVKLVPALVKLAYCRLMFEALQL